MSTYLDTLKLATRLEAGGFSMEQARALASALGDAAEVADLATKSDLRDLATKSDLRESELRLEGKIARVDARIEELALRTTGGFAENALRHDGKLAETKADILRWMFGAIGFQTLVTIGAIVALARLIKP